MRRRHAFLAASALLAVVLLPLARDAERSTLDAAARRPIAGRNVELSHGIVHYDIIGPTAGDVAVLVHGFSSPYYVWGELPSALAKAGYRVVRYDLYGRGFSDRPDVRYDQDLFDQQLVELLDALAIERRVHLVGLSMGGAIALEFAARHPERLGTLTLVDPAGWPIEEPAGLRLLEIPLLGSYLLKSFGDAMLIDANERAVFDKSLVAGLQEKFRVQLRYKGYKRAIVSTLRHMPLTNLRATYERVGRTKLPTLLVWGREDEIIPFDFSRFARDAMPRARFVPVDAAGHMPHYERPEVVGPAIVEFLDDHPIPVSKRERRRAERRR